MMEWENVEKGGTELNDQGSEQIRANKRPAEESHCSSEENPCNGSKHPRKRDSHALQNTHLAATPMQQPETSDALRPEEMKVELLCSSQKKLAFYSTTLLWEQPHECDDDGVHKCKNTSILHSLRALLEKKNARENGVTRQFIYRCLYELSYSLHLMSAERIEQTDLRLDNIFWEATKGNIFIGDNGGQANDGENQANILPRLAGIYKEVLPNGENHSAEASDIIRKMQRPEYNGITTETVLKHPFHWDGRKKLEFITKVLGVIKTCDREPRCEKWTHWVHAEEKWPLNSAHIIPPDQDWTKILKLSTAEIRNLRGSGKDIGRDEIYNTTFHGNIRRRENAYNGTSLYELLRFIRNHHAHFWDSEKKIRFCFGGNLEGMWNFFSEKFPWLFMHVYHNFKPYVNDEYGWFQNEMPFYRPLSQFD